MAENPARLSVIVPFHRNLGDLEACLAALVVARESVPNHDVEVVVSADGAVDDPADAARKCGARVVAVTGPRGPATARNHAAALASGDVLVFVDSDVVVHADALGRIASLMAERPEISAVFGAYDESPASSGFVSQAKNLAHAFVHHGSPGNAVTFWAGLGAVRVEALRAVGGFDERFARPSVEDIDLGYRLTAAGYVIVLDPAIQGTHLKRWSLADALVSDLRDRGIPWTQLIPRYGGLQTTLNLAHRYRLCVVLAYGACAGALVTFARPSWWPLPLACLAAMIAIDGDHYLFMARCRGWWFALRTLSLRLGHHLANGVSFLVGNTLYLARRLGIRLPWSLPLDPWTPGAADLKVRPTTATTTTATTANATTANATTAERGQTADLKVRPTTAATTTTKTTATTRGDHPL